MAELKAAVKQCDQFKQAFSKGDLQGCTRLLSGLKIALTTLPALSPNLQSTSTAQQELLLARDVLEHAVFLSVKLEDEVMFERNYLQLGTYYNDMRERMPPSENEPVILALNLMRLLVQNRIAEFHTELELLPAEARESPYVKHATQLEQYLMEGAYHRVLESKSSVPAPSFSYFMESLTTTVRDEIASCSEKAYTQLRVSDAKAMMYFDSEKDVLEYADKRGWEVQDGRLIFSDASRDPSGCKDIPSLELINYTLTYAKELERIV